MLFFYRETENGFVLQDKPEKRCWIHAEPVTQQDLTLICSLTGLHNPDVSDALDRHEIPRVEFIRGSLVLFVRYPLEQDKHLHTMALTIILHPDYFISLSLIHSPLIDTWLTPSTIPSNSSTKELLTQVLLKISQEFYTEIRKVRYNVMETRKEITAVTGDDISRLTEYEEILNQYQSTLTPLTETLQKLLKQDLLCEKTHTDIDDILNSIKQSDSTCSSLIRNIRNLRDSYQIVFANSLTKTIKLLTALTIIFSIPNIIASIYGMNVRLPLADQSHAFDLLMGMMFTVSLLCGYWFYRKKWM